VGSPLNTVPLWRLHLLRALYLLIVVGLFSVVWPGVIDPDKNWELKQGVVACMLAAFSALAVLGLRYPLHMLPLLMWELLWKTIWLLVVALPQWRAGSIDDRTMTTALECLPGLLILVVTPWRYVWAQYVTRPSERWR
jgi:hypothetical protein